MNQEIVFYPLILQVLLTFFVGFKLLQLRIKAVRQDGLNPRHFLLNRGGKIPDYLAKVDQHYINLFELPILFYLLVITLYVTQQVNLAQLILLWGFVISRLIHTSVHITFNALLWRLSTFIIGALLLFIAWIIFIWTALI